MGRRDLNQLEGANHGSAAMAAKRFGNRLEHDRSLRREYEQLNAEELLKSGLP